VRFKSSDQRVDTRAKRLVLSRNEIGISNVPFVGSTRRYRFIAGVTSQRLNVIGK
jgi:adenosyl cobinamide kinase/adenosyl cobinamide phosphate guanylyltransferase